MESFCCSTILLYIISIFHISFRTSFTQILNFLYTLSSISYAPVFPLQFGKSCVLPKLIIINVSLVLYFFLLQVLRPTENPFWVILTQYTPCTRSMRLLRLNLKCWRTFGVTKIEKMPIWWYICEPLVYCLDSNLCCIVTCYCFLGVCLVTAHLDLTYLYIQ